MNTSHLDELKREAQHSNDPARLRFLANAMQRLGAWDESEQARRKADRIEKEIAESVNA